MSVIFTADFQCEWSNIDRCQEAWEEILHICKKYKLKYIAVLGDLKQAMNPVDLRVVKWWQSAIRKAVKLGYKVILLRGNHDMIGNYTGAEDWFSILKRAGAITFSKSGTYRISDEITLTLIPYLGVNETRVVARNAQETLSSNAINILCFHQDITGAKYNQQGSMSDAKLSTTDLFSSSYDFCIGGHIHLPQLVKGTENVHYVGSPFCHDWGECNQVKRYIVIRKGTFCSIQSRSPAWYDPAVSNFSSPGTHGYTNTRVRISVQCDASTDYGRLLERARRKAEKKYRGAEIFVVPKFRDDTQRDLQGCISIKDTDERKIREYVRSRSDTDGSGNNAVEGHERILKYMLKVLSQFEGGLRPASKVKFKRAIGQNFLSFKRLDIDLSKKGITLIQGINEDRSKKSNGAGKTSAMQLLPVSLFGKTFKEQKSDAWSNRWIPKEPAFAEIILKNVDGKVIKVIRGRRPPLLKMYVDGKEVSSGMRSTDKDGTQQQIEKVTGFTWQTLANAVYIDRTVADAFLSGTNKQRTDVLSKFQQLERFEKALEQVKKDQQHCDRNINYYDGELQQTRTSIKHVAEAIADLQSERGIQVKNVKALYQRAKKRRETYASNQCVRFQGLVLKVGYARQDYDKLVKQCTKLSEKVFKSEAKYSEATSKYARCRTMQEKDTCPTCLQSVNTKWMKSYTKEAADKVIATKQTWLRATKEYNALCKDKVDAEAKYQLDENKLSRIKATEEKLKLEESTLRRQYNEASRKVKESSTITKQKQRLKKLKRKKLEIKSSLKKYKKQRRMYEYVKEAFSRDGIPAFLNRQLCPVLNKAAAYYASLFSESEIQVRFDVEEGEFIPKVINVRGGENIDDQSTGERALAGLIASFALREVAPSCNLLILDEPGEGLDVQTAKQLARSLQTLVKRFQAIWVCTHNVHILSELEGERVVTIRKRNRISRVEAA